MTTYEAELQAMDPNETLEAIRDLVHHSNAYTPRGLNWDDSAKLVELIESLDERLSRHDSLPEDWTAPEGWARRCHVGQRA